MCILHKHVLVCYEEMRIRPRGKNLMALSVNFSMTKCSIMNEYLWFINHFL